MTNSGKSPALMSDILITGGPGDCAKYNVPKQRCEGDKCDFRKVEILPGTSKGTLVPKNDEAHPFTGPGILTWPGFEACFIVRVDYEDEDRKPHKTGICMTYGRFTSRSCAGLDSNFAD